MKAWGSAEGAKGKEDLLDVYRALPTYAAQEGRRVAHIRRALRMALELAKDGWEADAVAVRDGLRAKLVAVGNARRKDATFTNHIEGLSTVTYRMLRVENGMLKPDDQGEQRSLPVTEQDVETVFSRSFVTLTEELAMSYSMTRTTRTQSTGGASWRRFFSRRMKALSPRLQRKLKS